MSKIILNLTIENGAKEVKDLKVLAKSGMSNGITFLEGDEIVFPDIDNARFSSIDFRGNTVYRIGCKVNGKDKWIPLGSFRKRSFLNYQEWIAQDQLKVNREFCEAGNDLALAEMLSGTTLKCVGKIDAQIAAEFVEDPITKERKVKRDADGNPVLRTAKFPIWELGWCLYNQHPSGCWLFFSPY